MLFLEIAFTKGGIIELIILKGVIYRVPQRQDYLDSAYASLFLKSTAQLICLLQGPFITFNICFDERFDLTDNKADGKDGIE